MNEHHSWTYSRRGFLATTAAAAAVLPLATAKAAAPYTRYNAASAGGQRALKSYAVAIEKMLRLPATDPRNWYRNALIHTLDCPHGNWWFLPWHRGYIGLFEQTVRDLSGDSEFAFPYWDWTASPQVPDFMYDGVLTPTDPAYIPTYDDFVATIFKPLGDFWSQFSADQKRKLLIRCLRDQDDLQFDIVNNPMFFPLANARGLTRAQPQLGKWASKAVSISTLLDALEPRDFITFGSPKTRFHSSLTGFGVLEGQPHNLVHNVVGGIVYDDQGKPTANNGGFMQDNLSPVDPLFFLHHSNMDRLWDVWTRKQQARGYDIQPIGGDLAPWLAEQFLFFVDSKGQPLSCTAGDFVSTQRFNYVYEPGSGEEVVPPPAAAPRTAAKAAPATVQRALGTVLNVAPNASGASNARVALPAAMADKTLFLKVELDIPPEAHERTHKITIGSAQNGAAQSDFLLTMFGHHPMTGTVTFLLPVPKAAGVRALTAKKGVKATGATSLDVSVVSEGMNMGPTTELLSVEVEAH